MIVEGGTKFGVALMQAPLQKLGGCAVLREGRCVGAVGWGSAVGIVGGGDGIGLVIMCGVCAEEVNGSGGASSNVLAVLAVGSRGGAVCGITCIMVC